MALQPAVRSPNFTRSALLHPLLRYLEARGIAVEGYLTEAGISPGSIRENDVPIPEKLFFEFARIISQKEGIEDIGLHAGREASLHMLGHFGQQLLRSKSVGGYLKKGCALINASASGTTFWMANENESKRFCVFVSGLSKTERVQNYLYIMMITVNTIRQATNQDWCPTEMVVPGIARETTVTLSAVVPETRIVTEGEFASILVHREWLDRPMPPGAKPGPLQTCDSSFTSVPTDFHSAISTLLENLIVTGRADLHTVSKFMGLKTRTLQRRLAAMDTNFKEMLAETRIVVAKRWLEQQEWPLADIARNLGYSDAANFSRAFRRITGLSPSTYRSRSTRADIEHVAPVHKRGQHGF